MRNQKCYGMHNYATFYINICIIIQFDDNIQNKIYLPNNN